MQPFAVTTSRIDHNFRATDDAHISSLRLQTTSGIARPK
jgi:hypothetical protein